MLQLYGAPASGSVAVEAMLTLLDLPYHVIDAETWVDVKARDKVAPTNPLRQVPALIFPDGEVMTESAAILIHLADLHPHARLAPGIEDPHRRSFLRWMTYVSTAIYSLYWVKTDPGRIGFVRADHDRAIETLHAIVSERWRLMDAQVTPGAFILGDEMTVLDLYVTVISRFGPWRRKFYEAAPGLAPIVRRVDAEPRLLDFWDRRFPFDEGWED